MARRTKTVFSQVGSGKSASPTMTHINQKGGRGRRSILSLPHPWIYEKGETHGGSDFTLSCGRLSLSINGAESSTLTLLPTVTNANSDLFTRRETVAHYAPQWAGRLELLAKQLRELAYANDAEEEYSSEDGRPL